MHPRYVVLYHETPPGYARGPHWDLMFQLDVGLLRTWALVEPPRDGPPFAAQQLGDHRLAYLDYEGPISDERGSVRRWDVGAYRLVSGDDSHWTAELEGRRLNGTVYLTRTGSGSDDWSFCFVSRGASTD